MLAADLRMHAPRLAALPRQVIEGHNCFNRDVSAPQVLRAALQQAGAARCYCTRCKSGFGRGNRGGARRGAHPGAPGECAMSWWRGSPRNEWMRIRQRDQVSRHWLAIVQAGAATTCAADFNEGSWSVSPFAVQRKQPNDLNRISPVDISRDLMRATRCMHVQSSTMVCTKVLLCGYACCEDTLLLLLS